MRMSQHRPNLKDGKRLYFGYSDPNSFGQYYFEILHILDTVTPTLFVCYFGMVLNLDTTTQTLLRSAMRTIIALFHATTII